MTSSSGSFEPTREWLAGNFPDLTDVQPLSEGGQKVVFAARHPVDGDVVLKVVRPSHDVEDVRREILAVQQVKSPNVPRIYAHGSIDTPFGSAYWIREERVHGQTLREVLQRGPLPAKDVLRLAKDLLGALSRAEDVHIVHRDVKPANIIVDNDDQFWLLDFGVARHLTLESITATAYPFGKMTVGYAPIEQIRNDKPAIDCRADLFALGVTLYEAATGTNPFTENATTLLEVLQRVEQRPLPELTIPIAAADDFRDFMAAISQRRRDHRPATVRDAQIWLDEILARQPD